MLNNLLQMQLKLLQKKTIQETAEATGDFVGNKIANRITKVSRISRQNISETVKMSMINTLRKLYISRSKTEKH